MLKTIYFPAEEVVSIVFILQLKQSSKWKGLMEKNNLLLQ